MGTCTDCSRKITHIGSHNVSEFVKEINAKISASQLSIDIKKYELACSMVLNAMNETFFNYNYEKLLKIQAIIDQNFLTQDKSIKPYYLSKLNFLPMEGFFKIFQYINQHSYYIGFCIKEEGAIIGTELGPQFDLALEDKPKSPSRRILSSVPHGFGCLLMDYSSSYIKLFEGIFQKGDFKEGIVLDAHCVYFGGFSTNGYEGEGSLYNVNGIIYKGIFHSNVLHGTSCYINLPDQYTYHGECKYGNAEGVGAMKYTDPKSTMIEYTGEFLGNMRNGKGTMKYKDGSVYSGDWANNFYHGDGALMCANGEEYSGKFEMGERNGIGRLVKKNKENGNIIEIYEGEWKYNEKHGAGKLLYYNFKGEEHAKEGNWIRNRFEENK